MLALLAWVTIWQGAQVQKAEQQSVPFPSPPAHSNLISSHFSLVLSPFICVRECMHASPCGNGIWKKPAFAPSGSCICTPPHDSVNPGKISTKEWLPLFILFNSLMCGWHQGHHFSTLRCACKAVAAHWKLIKKPYQNIPRLDSLYPPTSSILPAPDRVSNEKLLGMLTAVKKC